MTKKAYSKLNLAKFWYYCHNSLRPWHYCHVCKIPHVNLICDDCYHELEKLPATTCRYCKKLVLDSSDSCSSCKRQKPFFDNLYCLFSYANPLTKMLHELKYAGKRNHVMPLGYLLYQSMAQIPSIPEVIVPMPLHLKRMRERKFNQVNLMLNYYRSIDNRVPINHKLVRKVKDTQHQTLTSQQSRKINLMDAFQLVAPVAGMHLLIVDDVVTTGTTANELAKLFKQNGAKQVEICCLMRAL
jgi:ComF family protein